MTYSPSTARLLALWETITGAPAATSFEASLAGVARNFGHGLCASGLVPAKAYSSPSDERVKTVPSAPIAGLEPIQ